MIFQILVTFVAVAIDYVRSHSKIKRKHKTNRKRKAKFMSRRRGKAKRMIRRHGKAKRKHKIKVNEDPIKLHNIVCL